MDNSILSGKGIAPGKKTKVVHLNPAHKGLLHKKLGKKPGEKLTTAELQKAKGSSSPSERKEANFAMNAKKWAKK